jgi:hypothetical protein
VDDGVEPAVDVLERASEDKKKRGERMRSWTNVYGHEDEIISGQL